MDIPDLLDEIIAAARDRGLTQAELAERAGLSAVGLSKAKGRGDLRASLLAALAEAAGLRLELRPAESADGVREAIQAGSFFRRGDD